MTVLIQNPQADFSDPDVIDLVGTLTKAAHVSKGSPANCGHPQCG